MKHILLILTIAAITTKIEAQPILSNGFGYMAAVNGTTYTKTTNVGTANYSAVGASGDGQLFYAGNNSKLYFIRVSDNAFIDSMPMSFNPTEYASGNEAQTLFTGSNGGSALYRINSQTKAIDSILLSNVPFRVEERPNAKEVWVAADSMIHVISYASGLSSLGTIRTSNNKFDNGDVRFTKGGTIAYKSSASKKKIYKIDAATRAILDSIDTSPFSFPFAQPSTDSNKLYASPSTNTIYIYSVSSKALVDSIISPKLAMNIYRHPQRAEIWAIDHFADSVIVFDESNKNMLAGIPIGPDPFFLAFSTGTVGVKNISATNATDVKIYPNPATHQLNIAIADNIEHTAVIYDMSGRKLMTAIVHGVATMDISALANSIYNLIITQAGIPEKTIPFIKE